jgi:hypothetical protein
MKIILHLILICISNSIQAQTIDSVKSKSRHYEKGIGLLTGVSAGKYVFVDLGISFNRYGQIGQHPITRAWFMSNELRLNNKIIAGPKVGGWIAGGSSAFALGMNLIYYTDFTNGSLTVRPEIGFGVHAFKFVYGYNAQISNPSFTGINISQVSFTYCFNLIKHRCI